MTLSLVENVIVAGADNRPPMLEKTNYNSWASRMLLYIKGKENGDLLVDSVLNGPFQLGTIEVPVTANTPTTIRKRTQADLTDKEKLRASVDIKATNIERESQLYDDFDMLTSQPGETIHSYYMRFDQLINDMHTIGMTMQTLQVNTKFVNHLPPEWGKFVTDVKLLKDMHTTNFDHLYAHIWQHEAHANEMTSATQQYYSPPALQRSYNVLRVQQLQYQPQVSTYTPVHVHQSYQAPALQQSYQAPTVQQLYQAPALQQSYQQPTTQQTFHSNDVHQPAPQSFPQLDSRLAVPSFNPTDDPIESLNKAMAFISTSFASRFPQTNNQLRTSYNPRNQATIQDGRVTVQTVQGRQTQGYANNGARNTTITRGTTGIANVGQGRVVKCYNCQEEDDLDAFDYDYDDAPSAKVVLMANLSSYDLHVLSELLSAYMTDIPVMYSASSAVTYTSIYTNSEPGRVFWGADDKEPVPQDEDEHEPRFIQAPDPDFVLEPVYLEYLPLEDEHVLPAEEQPLPPVDSPAAESPGYVTESYPEEDSEKYEDDEIEDGPVNYPMDRGDDGDDDDGDSSRDDAEDEDEDEEDEEDEEEEEHLAPADSADVVPTSEPVSLPKGTELVIPPSSTDISNCWTRLLSGFPCLPYPYPPNQDHSTSYERLLAMTTPSPSPPISLSPPSAGERLARCMASPTHSSPPPLPSPLPPSFDDIPESEASTSQEVAFVHPELQNEIGKLLLARPYQRSWGHTRVSKIAEVHERDIQDVYTLLEDAQDGRSCISQRVDRDSQRVDLLMGDRMTLQETVWMVEEEAYASREAWAHSID
ncbi:hypothetical protein Tco_1104687 [Tanacetum coccineum]